MSMPAAREAAMQLVFEQLFGGEGESETLVELTGYEPKGNDAKYIERVVSGVREKRGTLDEKIAPCLRGWALERIISTCGLMLPWGSCPKLGFSPVSGFPVAASMFPTYCLNF